MENTDDDSAPAPPTWTARNEAELRVLLSEKEHADRQIGGYLDLQLKLLAFLFAGLSTGIGIAIASQGELPPPSRLGYFALFLVLVASIVMLQGVVLYGISLGYIHFKRTRLVRQIADLLRLDPAGLDPVRAFNEGPAGTPVFAASFVLLLFYFFGSIILIAFAVSTVAHRNCWFYLTLTATIAAVLAAVVVQAALARAMLKTARSGAG